jgi:hypothetical protein
MFFAIATMTALVVAPATVLTAASDPVTYLADDPAPPPPAPGDPPDEAPPPSSCVCHGDHAVRSRCILRCQRQGVAAPSDNDQPPLPGRVVDPWISAQPRIHAIGNPCAIAARRYRDDLNYVPPQGCWNTWYFQGGDESWRVPLP